jgi:urea transport system substrate-binding protein
MRNCAGRGWLLGFGANAVGDFIAASYFQSVDTPASIAFRQKFEARYGKGRVVSDAMAAAYTGVHIWAAAAGKANSVDPAAVREAIRGLSYDGPAGRVRIDAGTLHADLPALIGKVSAKGELKIVAERPAVAAVPYPPGRSQREWDSFLTGLRVKWNGWQNTGP